MGEYFVEKDGNGDKAVWFQEWAGVEPQPILYQHATDPAVWACVLANLITRH